MDVLSAARAQMGFSLAFHMIFAAFGIGMPLLMVIAEGFYLRTGKEHYLRLAKKWGKATGLLFAIGAVSGTALSFELGLLWPNFMHFAGGIVGPAFALEGFFFFIEAIFLGLYLYGWDKLSPKWHWWTGIPVVVCGAGSGIIVVAVNAWMQVPVGYEYIDPDGNLFDPKNVHNIHPLAPFLSPAWIPLAVHSTLSCYIAVGFAVAGVYAVSMLRGKTGEYNRSALTLALGMATVCAVLQPLSGHLLGIFTATHQPIKLAAMEALFKTRTNAPLLLGGIVDVENEKVDYAIEIPSGLSMMVSFNPDAKVEGLNAAKSKADWPDVFVVHMCFQIMVGCGMILMLVGLWFWYVRWRGGGQPGKWLLRALVLVSPLGIIALEAGWMVTELGRQPWIIYERMRTSQAVTDVPEVPVSFFTFTALYLILGFILVFLLRNLGKDPIAPITPQPQTPTDTEEVPHAAS